MNRTIKGFGGIAILLLFFEVVHADRVYQFVDYPAVQSGYSLSGSITTADDAPADGKLLLNEVIDWRYHISGPGVSIFSVLGPHPIQPSWPLTGIKNIAISSNAIELRPVIEPAFELFSLLELVDYISPGPNQTISALRWQTSNDPSLRFPGTFVRSEAFVLDQGNQEIWLSEMNVGASGWVIATYVPEPASIMFGLCVALILGLRRIGPVGI